MLFKWALQASYTYIPLSHGSQISRCLFKETQASERNEEHPGSTRRGYISESLSHLYVPSENHFMERRHNQEPKEISE